MLNADGTGNVGGLITDYLETEMIVGNHREKIRFTVTNLASSNIFLGHDWLERHNPDIDWKAGQITFNRCPEHCDDPTNRSLDVENRFVVTKEGWEEPLGEVEGSRNPWPTYLAEYGDVFSEADFENLPEHRPWDHVIELKPGFKPVDCKPYPLSPDERRATEEFIKKELKTGRIRPSSSPMASGFFYVKKADGTLRPVQDYRLVNKETVLDKYGPPRIDGLFDKVKDATIITKLDVRWGYYNIRLREGDEWKAAFRTHLGLFEPTVMFFGLCNAPATFQRFMNDIFRELILEGSVVIYLDDILIFSKDKEEHHRLVKRVFDVLQEHKLYLKPEKCEFDRDHVTYLGHIIGNGQIRMDPKNVKAVSDWPEPKNVKELQQFLGLGNWLRRFVKDYSAIVRPMTKLTGKVDWQWEGEQRQAFAELKQRLCNPPVLAIPNDEDPFRIETDASDYATGGVLLQKQEGLWKVVAYRSSTLHDAE